jgi:hypothetical protein
VLQLAAAALQETSTSWSSQNSSWLQGDFTKLGDLMVGQRKDVLESYLCDVLALLVGGANVSRVTGHHW